MNNTRKPLGIVLLSSAVLMLTTTVAEAIVFNFGGNGSNGFEGTPSLSFLEDGLSLSVTAFDSNNSARNVTQRNNGLGVRRTGFFDFLDSPQIDGLGPDETLLLAFGTSGDQKVVLNSATFGRVDRNDEFTLLTDGTTFLADADIPNSGLFSFTSFARADRTASGFGFRTTDLNDNYYLKAVDVATVPEPLTIFGTAVAAGFGALFQRKRSKQS